MTTVQGHGEMFDVAPPTDLDDEQGGFAVTSTDDPRCAVRTVLDRVADKWTALVVSILADRRHGYAQLRRSTPGISDKMLAQTLRRLERDGLVARSVEPSTPIRVFYELTDIGATLVPPLSALVIWAEEHGDELVSNQARFDALGRR